MQKAATILVPLLVACLPLLNGGNQEEKLVKLTINDQIDSLIGRFKGTGDGREFLQKHLEQDLKKVVFFLQSPSDGFCAVQDVQNICPYIWAIDWYLSKHREPAFIGFFGFLRRNFQAANAENVQWLTHLILHCGHAFLEEALANHYTVLFENSPGLFVKELEKTKDWRKVIATALGGDWRAFKAGLAKLKDSRFEVELKDYVRSLVKDKEFSARETAAVGSRK
jgi:hypothetical protein